MRVQEWRELVATMLLLPLETWFDGDMVCLAAISPRSPAKLMHDCMAVSLMPSSKGRAALFLWCGKGIGKTKANYLTDFYFDVELLTDASLLFSSRSGELMTALHTGLCYQGLKINLELFVREIFPNCKRVFIKSSTDSCFIFSFF